MASTYAYATLADIENFTGIDYSAVDSTAFSDVRVDATITMAERMVNAYLGITDKTADTTTDAMIMATIIITAKLMNEKMINLGYALEEETTNEFIKMTYNSILRNFLYQNEDCVDNIPMNGANLYIGSYGNSTYGGYP